MYPALKLFAGAAQTLPDHAQFIEQNCAARPPNAA